MIRFRVIRASRILLILSLAVLFAVIGFLIFSSKDSGTHSAPAASLVQKETAETQTVFAVSNDNENNGFSFIKDAEGISVEILNDRSTQFPNADSPSVLIYHTHTHEAYEQNLSDPYEAVSAWRTRDSGHSVVRVGRELKEALERYGFRVVHDTTDHEGNDLSTAYERSLKTLREYDELFDIYIDLHRDAYSEGLQLRHATNDGITAANIMLLIGNGNGFEDKPDFEKNHLFAKNLTRRINKICPGLCRDVLVKDGRYNQHIGGYGILVEVGHNKNTLAEALASVPYLARGINELMSSEYAE